MADKRFSGPNEAVERADVTADYEAAERFGKLRVGTLGVYYRDGFRTRFFPYGEIDRVFIRIQEVNGKLCCGKAVFQYFRMVFLSGGKEYAEYLTEDEASLDAALARIHELSPDTPVGVPAPAEG